MLLFILLAAAAPATGAETSAEVRAVSAERGELGDEAFLARVELLAERGDSSAIELLGEVYFGGLFGTPRNPVKACGYFARVANLRGDSAHNFALCYEKGEGVPKDGAKARQWYARGAELGYIKSGCALGNLMVAGTGGPQDVPGGISLCRKGAEAGNADAQTDLGNHLLRGQGVARNVIEARKWYALAAEQNQANAQFVLGQIHWNGDGTPVDPDAAVDLWKRAYAGGRKDAAALIVGALFKRIPVERDGKTTFDRAMLPEAIIWVERAATEDPDPARRQKFAEVLAMLRSGG